jgi:hypothetical protein
MIKRYLEPYIVDDLKEKMVFLSGPRQVGKTTLSKDIGKEFYKDNFLYLCWDQKDDKKLILKGIWPAEKKLIILDEIHKYPKWKNFVKGEHDKHNELFRIMVTGSAKLDIYRKGGDSLQGRYFPIRLHPFSLAELTITLKREFEPFKTLEFKEGNHEIFERLFHFGGFPEPYNKQDQRFLRRWQLNRLDRLINDDIKSVQFLKDITSMEILVGLLPSKVGSLFSLNSLREDLQVSHDTMSSWVEILEKFYYHFRIYPYVNKLNGSYKKEPKLFLWDWSEVIDKGARLENLVAGHLMKFCHYLEDVEGYEAELFFLKNKPSHEVDFLVTVKKRPWFCVEVKNSIEKSLTSLKYYGRGLNIPFVFQVVNVRDTDIIKDNVRIMSVEKFLNGLI